MAKQAWVESKVGGESFALLDLDDRGVEERIMEEMGSGVAVFYDRRWEVTEELTDWLGDRRGLYEGKRVLVLGAGVGAETLLLGKYAEKLWVNDLAPVSIELCLEQLEKNGIQTAKSLLGRYENLNLPKVDLTVGSFLVYDVETRASMKAYLQQLKDVDGRLILMNENLPDFIGLLNEERHEVLFEKEGALCVCFGELMNAGKKSSYSASLTESAP